MNYQFDCKACGQRMSEPAARCSKCQQETDLPRNVLMAAKDSVVLERRLSAVAGRYQKRRLPVTALARRLSDAVRVTINARPASVIPLLHDRDVLYLNVHDLHKIRARRDLTEEGVEHRKRVDFMIFGMAAEEIYFGSASLGGHGLLNYGSICLQLRPQGIEQSTSFLARNSYRYFVQNEGAGFTCSVPPGDRAIYRDFGALAIVKHEAALDDLEKKPAEVIVSRGNSKKEDEFIEAQIGCRFGIESIEKVTYCPGADRRRSKNTNVQRAEETTRSLARYLAKVSAEEGLFDFEVIEPECGEEAAAEEEAKAES